MNWRDATTTTLLPLTTAQRLGLITDMDGTISPIVPQPDAAQITPLSRELLEALAERLALVAVVSGRAVTDVHWRVGLPGLVYVGNHGLEQWVGGQVEISPEALPYRPALEAALRDMRQQLVPGMTIDDKGATLTLHYRQTVNPEATSAEFLPVIEGIAARHGLACFQGRMVFELRPPLAIDKGTALRRLVDEYQLDAAIFMGDDTTDVDALRAARELRTSGGCYALGIGVQSDDAPSAVIESADLLVSGVPDVEAFMAWLLSVLRASSS